MGRVAFAIGVVLSAALHLSPTRACEPEDMTTAWSEREHVFVGEVTDIHLTREWFDAKTPPAQPPYIILEGVGIGYVARQSYSLAPMLAWKGARDGVYRTDATTTDLRLGDLVLLYADTDDDGELQLADCARLMPLPSDEARSDLRFLGAPADEFISDLVQAPLRDLNVPPIAGRDVLGRYMSSLLGVVQPAESSPPEGP